MGLHETIVNYYSRVFFRRLGFTKDIIDEGRKQVFTSQGDGIFGCPNQSGFRVYPSLSQSISNNTETTVVLGTEYFDQQNEFDTSTNKFTATQSGIYLITGAVLYKSTNMVDQTRLRLFVIKNPSGAAENILEVTRTVSGANWETVVLSSGMVILSAGDVLTLNTWQDSGNILDLQNNINTYFAAWKLG